MFTGLIEHTTPISSITPSSSSSGFTFTFSDAAPILGDCAIGDSICINGACVTVTAFDAVENGGWFKVGLAPETLNRTNLGQLNVGDKVNCERAMSAHTRFGGHMVQGHVDTTANIVSKVPDGNSIRFTFELPSGSTHYLAYIVEKGFITLDGASLTITLVDEEKAQFGVMLIPHTQEILTLTKKAVGESVNVEVDLVGKYVLGSEKRIEGIVDRIVEKKLKDKGLI
ncbi:riboflavin synthase [Naematelia encephala]|uniref:Riboflavin synthase n=1 Tax=Naematelia encephala TaxID=71784 RepID=A0A1Y2AQU2_9TREE|nr:riboflavin synthase [Naematelia encephala]